MTEFIQQDVRQGVQVHDKTFKDICGESGTIVIADRRIAKVSNDNGDFKPQWNEGWFDTNIFRGAAAHIEAAAQTIMNDLNG